MAHPPQSPSFLRQLLEAAGWSIEPVPSGWRAQEPSPGDHVVLAYGERELPAGFQRHVPDRHGEVLILFAHEPSPHELDRVHLAGARPVGPDEAPGVMLELLHPEAAPAEPPAAEAPVPPPEPDPSTWRETDGTEPGEPPPPPRPIPEVLPLSLPTEPSSETALRQDPRVFPPEVFEPERIVRPRLHEEDLRSMALGRWRGGSPRLLLIPFYVFAYALPEDEDSPTAPSRLVAVPAVGGLPQFWPVGEREIISAIGHPHRRPPRRIDAREAEDRALQAVRERHARHEESAEQRRGMLVIENRRRPREAQEVRLGPPAWVWVPHWVVEAWNGREVIDAVTGLPAHFPLEHEDSGD